MVFDHVNNTLGREGTPGSKMEKRQGAEEQPGQRRCE